MNTEDLPLTFAIPSGTQCAVPSCFATYAGDPELFVGEGWGLLPIERFAFCRSHSATPAVLKILRAAK